MNYDFLILLADDDDDDRYIFESALNDINKKCMVSQVEDGEKLIEFVNNSIAVPDFIILDINMPKISGLECLKYIKNKARYDKANILMLSTGTSNKDVEEAYHQGASLYIKKPQNYSEMKSILSYCINSDFPKNRSVSLSSFLISDSSQLK